MIVHVLFLCKRDYFFSPIEARERKVPFLFLQLEIRVRAGPFLPICGVLYQDSPPHLSGISKKTIPACRPGWIFCFTSAAHCTITDTHTHT